LQKERGDWDTWGFNHEYVSSDEEELPLKKNHLTIAQTERIEIDEMAADAHANIRTPFTRFDMAEWFFLVNMSTH
jgi:hypothetical protein